VKLLFTNPNCEYGRWLDQGVVLSAWYYISIDL